MMPTISTRRSPLGLVAMLCVIVGIVATLTSAVWLSIVPSPVVPKLPTGFTAVTPTPPAPEDLLVVEGANKLFIPDLRISAEITPGFVHQDSSGTILPPADPTLVATVAGGSSQNASTGTWLLIGHVQTVDVAQGALWNLADAQPGELVATTDANGDIQWWQVSELLSVPKTQFPFNRVRASGDRQLWIITCGGAGQTHNVIAVAVPVGVDG